MILMTPAYIAATVYPQLNARIGWQNLARGAVITASSVAAGSYLQAPISDQTWEWWRPTAGAGSWWAATFATTQVVNYCAIAAHELGSAGATIKVQADVGAGWVDVADAVLTPADDAPIMILFEDHAADAMRVVITAASQAPRIGIIHFGAILEMPRPARWMGHTPGVLNRSFTVRPNESERGQRLGNSLIRAGLSAAFEFSNLDETWVRSTFDLFMRNCMRYGYFISWRPDQFPDEVFYGWTDKPFAPTNSQGGINRRMSVSFPMDCFNYQNVTAWGSS
jgi:hypothetical protein